MSPLRIVFLGSAAFAVPTLAELLGAGHDLRAVYAAPPRPAGRGLADRRSPVHAFAARHGLEVRTPGRLDDAAEQRAFAGLGADVAVVVAYGLILPKPVLEAPAMGCLNLHASLLPRWRGAAPIARAIMAGDRETGVAVMRMEQGLDTGPIAMVERVPIGADTIAGELHDQLASLGADLMARALAALAKGALDFTPQAAEGVTYAKKIAHAEARIEFARPADELHNLVRALAPAPGAFLDADLGKGIERVKVLRSAPAAGAGAPGILLDEHLTVACRDSALRLLEVQRAGGRPMAAEAFLRGTKLRPGARLG